MITQNKGNVLVILLFFMVLAVTVVTASISLMIISGSSTTLFVSGNQARSAAESGIEEALIRLIRNPDYTGQNDLPVGNDTADISVSGAGTKTIISTGESEGRKKTIRVEAEHINNILTVTSWKEVQ